MIKVMTVLKINLQSSWCAIIPFSSMGVGVNMKSEIGRVAVRCVQSDHYSLEAMDRFNMPRLMLKSQSTHQSSTRHKTILRLSDNI